MMMLRDWQDEALGHLPYSQWMSLFPTIYQFSRYLDVYQRLLQSAGRREADQYDVTSLLAPRVDEALTGTGSRFDAPPAPLQMGLHWVLRELVRFKCDRWRAPLPGLLGSVGGGGRVLGAIRP